MAAGHWQQRGRQDNGCDQAKPSSLLASASKTRNESGPPSALGADRAADAVRVRAPLGATGTTRTANRACPLICAQIATLRISSNSETRRMQFLTYSLAIY